MSSREKIRTSGSTGNPGALSWTAALIIAYIQHVTEAGRAGAPLWAVPKPRASPAPLGTALRGIPSPLHPSSAAARAKHRHYFTEAAMADVHEIRPIDDAPTWDAFVRQAVGGTVFSTRAWLKCAASASGGRVCCCGLFRNGNLVAGISGLEHRRAGLKRLQTPVLTPHGGMLYAPVAGKGPAKQEAEWGAATQLLAEHLGREYAQVQLAHAPAVRDLRAFVWAGWEVRVRYTHQLDLSDPTALWERLERRTRTVIHKAEQAGFCLRPASDVDLFRRQYEMIYAHQGERPPVPAEVVQRFAAQALDAGMAEGYLVESPQGAVAAIVLFVRGFETVYAWVAGADPALSHTGAASLLYWRFFEQSPCKHFDFVGANIPAIALFKRGFGGDLVPYFAVEGYRHGWVKALFRGRRRLP